MTNNIEVISKSHNSKCVSIKIGQKEAKILNFILSYKNDNSEKSGFDKDKMSYNIYY